MWSETNSPTCPESLQSCPHLRRYNVRHDGVLDVIYSFVSTNLPRGYRIIADLPNQAPFTFPPHIATTDLRPDLVVCKTHKVVLFELTVCYEPNFDEALRRKTEKYLDLVQVIRQRPQASLECERRFCRTLLGQQSLGHTGYGAPEAGRFHSLI